MPMSESLREQVIAAVERAGLDCEEVIVRTVGARKQVTVVVDKDGGVDLDTVADMSGVVSALLDDAPEFDEPFVLEVTSPGVDRPLTLPRHWARAQDRLVEVSLHDGLTTVGRVVESDDKEVVVRTNVKGRIEDHRISFADVSKAIVQVEFSKPREGGDR